MKYSRLAACYRDLEATQSTLEKTSILAELFEEASPDELEILAHLVMGRQFPAWKDLETGIGDKLMVQAISRATGLSEDEVTDAWREKGDLGDVAEAFVGKKKQQTLGTKPLTPSLVQENLEDMAKTSGSNSQEQKIGEIAELLGFATPEEAKYIVRTVLGQMRVGVGEGLVRDAVVEAFFAETVGPGDFTKYLEETGMDVAIEEDVKDDVADYGLFETFEQENSVSYVDPDDLTLQDLWTKNGYDLVVAQNPGRWDDALERLVQHAYDVTTDFGNVARTTAEDGPEGLQDMEIELFRPVKVMLAQKAESMEDGFDTVGDDENNVALEYKYDGMRVQIHKKGDEVKVFTRRLEDVTTQFPDIVQAVKDNVSADTCIIEGETVAYDPETGEKIPFQQLSKRIKRKYDIDQMVSEIPVTTFLFDIIYLDGESVIKEPLRERLALLKNAFTRDEQRLELADHLETTDMEEAQAFYQEALQENQEGIMLKSMTARYKPGSRVGYMVKLKPVMETLDLVIVAADWGEGRRSQWIGSYTLACHDPTTGEFKTVGKMATGFTDEQLEEMTERLEDKIIETSGRNVTIDPSVVVEVAYEEIQQSPQYESGYALRFPRLVQVREDMGPDDANDLEKVERLYDQQ